jgi:hypothetical protein
MRLHELLNNIQQDDFLTEAYKDLAFVKSKFKELFKVQRDPTRNLSNNKFNLMGGIGENSKVTVVPVKNARDLEAAMKDVNKYENPAINDDGTPRMSWGGGYQEKIRTEFRPVLGIIEAHGEQVALIRVHLDKANNPKTNTTSDKYDFFVDMDLLVEHTHNIEELNTLAEKSKFADFEKGKVIENDQSLNSNEFYSMIGLLFKILKTTDLLVDLKIHVAYNDITKGLKRNYRYDQKDIKGDYDYDFDSSSTKQNGRVPLERRPGKNNRIDADKYAKDETGNYINDNAYLNKAKKELIGRLAHYKKVNAVSVESNEELIARMKKDGFIKNFKINEFTYNLHEMNNIHLDNFTNPGKYKPSVTYRLVGEGPKYEEKVRLFAQFKKMFIEDPEKIEFPEGMSDSDKRQMKRDLENENNKDIRLYYDKYMPPTEIYVELKLGKGGIVPSRVMGKNEN